MGEQDGEAGAERDLWPEGKVQALSREELSSLASAESRKQATMVVRYAPWCQFSQVGSCGRLCDALCVSVCISVASAMADNGDDSPPLAVLVAFL